MTTKPIIDPLRARIFSELNLQLGHHGIKKQTMNITAKHRAFLVRYYAGVKIDPLSVSVPILEVPVTKDGDSSSGDSSSDDDGVAMAHKICLVVQSAPQSSSAASAKERTSTAATVTAKVVKKKVAPTPAAAPVAGSGAIRVLIEQLSTLGHRECLINGFMGLAEGVVAAVVSGVEEDLRGEKKNGKGPLWDV